MKKRSKVCWLVSLYLPLLLLSLFFPPFASANGKDKESELTLWPVLALLGLMVLGFPGIAYSVSTPGDFNVNADGIIHSIAVQGDGKIVVGGGFTSIGGVTRNNIAG